MVDCVKSAFAEINDEEINITHVARWPIVKKCIECALPLQCRADRSKVLRQFACWYVALFFVFAQMEGFYGGFFRTVGELIYGKKDRVSEVSFETLGQGDDSIDTRVVIVNEALMKPDGSGPVRNLDIGTRGFGSMPLAFLISLILASPVPWPRRSKAVMWGIFWQQVSVF